MSEESIFHRIVRSEDSHTQLLFNFLSRDERIRDSFVRFVTGERTFGGIQKRQLFVQKGLKRGGRADLLIESPQLSLIVEVKTENGCGRRGRQLINEPEHNPASYLSHLTSEEARGKRRMLIFLIPPDWRQRGDVTKEIDAWTANGKIRKVDVRLCTWDELIQRCKDDVATETRELWQEFQQLLSLRFEPVRLTEEEIRSMKSGQMTLLSAIRLNKVIADVRVKAKKAKLPVTELSAEPTEFGFYLQQKPASLFFGCSPAFWGDDPPALCCLVNDGFGDAFKKSMIEIAGTKLLGTAEWFGFGFADDDIAQGADHLFFKLQKLWQRAQGHLAAPAAKNTIGLKKR